jgi:hypothetical protein
MKHVRHIAVAALSALTLVVASGVAGASTTWQRAAVVHLPRGVTSLPQGYLPALSCASANNCSAGGAVTDTRGRVEGLLLREVHGTWRAPVTLVAPKGAAANPQVTITSISCASASSCGVVGSYQDTHANTQSFVASDVRGSWSPAREVALPPDAARTLQDASLHSVSCSSVGNCSAVGTYVDSSTSRRTRAMVVSEVRGSWRRAMELRLPPTANLDPFVTISQISCAHVGTCSVVGSFTDSNSVVQGLVIDQVAGAWERGVVVTLPGEAGAYANASLSEIGCSGPGNCAALGTFVDSVGQDEAMSVTESAGTWSRAVSLVMPVGAGENPKVTFYGYDGISCPSTSNCSGGGQYVDATGDSQGFVVSEVNGMWTSAISPTLPAGAQQGGHYGGIVSVSCRSAGNCSAGGAYLDGSGSYQALIVNELRGVWQTGQKVALPGAATTIGVDGGVYGLVCHAKGPCTAIGSFLKTSSAYQGFTVTTH